LINIPDIPPKHYFKVSPGYSEYNNYMLDKWQTFDASVKLYKWGFWGSKLIVSIDIPNTGPRLHPTIDQIEDAMKTAALYAER
jgi:hypothetical protein